MNADAIPDALRENDRWLLWDESADSPRQPHWRGDFIGISWSDPDDWHTFEDAVEAAQERDSWGIGYVFTPDHEYYAVDVDGPYDDDGEPRGWFPGIGPFDGATYGEWSPGGGLHFIVEGEPPEWWRDCEVDPDLHRGVDVLTNKFCTITGDRIKDGADGVAPVDADSWYTQVYHRIRGELPNTNRGDHTDSDPDAELTKEQIEDALSHINPDLAHTEWISLGYAVKDWDSGSTGKSVFERWSRKGTKWDNDAQRSVDWIWQNDSNPRDPATVGTLVYHAKQGGWEPPWAKQAIEDGGAKAATPTDADGTDHDSPVTWPEVTEYLQSDANGSTTHAYYLAKQKMNQEYDFVTVRDTSVVYFYDESRGIYVNKGETYIDEILNEKLGGHINVNRVRNVREQIVAANYVATDDFQPEEGKVCVKNGVLDLESRELEDHTPDYYFTSRLDVEYDPEADAPLWQNFLSESVADNKDMDKLEEFIGYALEPWHHDRAKNLFIVGPSQTGKSTFVDTVVSLFNGVPSAVSLTPQQIADTRFDAALLRDAMLNAANDINASKVEDTGTLKRVLAGESTKMERKGKDAEFGEPKAKHVFSANWLPRLVGQDEAFFRRVLIAEFPNQVPDSERDTKLGEKLKREAPGILNRALDARDRLHERDRFTNDRSRPETRRKWDSWQDAHKRFLYTQFEITGDSEDKVDRDAYYRAYKEFAAREGFDIKPKQGVTKSLQWVAEIGVRKKDDHYRGLVWRDEQATVSTTTDTAQASLNKSQNERVQWVKKHVEAFATPTHGADRDKLVEYAEDNGFDAGDVARTIDELREDGILYPNDGGLRVN